jgi:hypothetical protein
MDCHTMGWEPIKMNTLVQSIVITSPLGFCISLNHTVTLAGSECEHNAIKSCKIRSHGDLIDNC